jgi:hypothetical protein
MGLYGGVRRGWGCFVRVMVHVKYIDFLEWEWYLVVNSQ